MISIPAKNKPIRYWSTGNPGGGAPPLYCTGGGTFCAKDAAEANTVTIKKNRFFIFI